MTYNWNMRSYDYRRNQRTPYKCPFTEDEKRRLLRLYKYNYNNEECTRLDSITNIGQTTVLQISKVNFFEHLVTNRLYESQMKFLITANQADVDLMHKLCNRLDTGRLIDGLTTLLSKDYLANILAVSCMIKDTKGKYLIVRRNRRVGVSENFWCVSMTGTVSGEDFESADPIKQCAVRECLEELCYDIEFDNISIPTILCGKAKTQPVALVNVLVDDIQDITDNLKDFPGFAEENSEYFAYTKDDIKDLLNNYPKQLTEAAVAHMTSAIQE